jgi:hypothetical protein
LPTPPLPVKNKYLVVESVIFVLSDVKVFRINVSSFRVRHNGLYKKRFNAFIHCYLFFSILV